MDGRTIAIGDVHGCSTALQALLGAIQPQPNDLIVTLGDYVDRGPDSRGVIEQLIDLGTRCRLVALLGNHDEVLLDVRAGRESIKDWIDIGGKQTLASYGSGRDIKSIPLEHFAFFESCLEYYETDDWIFLHASYDPAVAMADQEGDPLRWQSLHQSIPGRHYSGKTVITGHSAQKSGEILDLGYLKCIDTYCYGGGWLTALDVLTEEVWQVDQEGKMRR